MLFIYSDSYLTYYERSGIYFEHSKRLPVAYQLRRKYSYSAEVGEVSYESSQWLYHLSC